MIKNQFQILITTSTHFSGEFFFRSIRKYLALLFIVLIGSNPSFSATVTSVGYGNWNSTTNNAPWPGGVVPANTDIIVIASNVTVTSAATCAGITINSGSTFTINSGITLTVNGDINGAGILSSSASPGGIISLNGNFAFNGTYSSTSRISATFTGANDQTINSSGTISWRNFTINKSGGVLYITNTPSLTFGVATLTAGNICYNGAAQSVFGIMYTNLTLAGSGTKTTSSVTVNDTLFMEGTAVGSAAPVFGTAATLIYNSATAHTIGAEWRNPFNGTGGVIIKNTGTITLNSTEVLSASVPLTIESGASLNTDAARNRPLTLGGDFHNYGTFTANGSTITINGAANQSIDGFSTTGSLNMNKTGGTATFMGNVSGNNLGMNNSGTLNLGSGLTHIFTGTWTRSAGTLNCGSSLLKIGGSRSGSGGTFTANTGTVEWNRSGTQTIAGVVYNNLILSGSGQKTTTGATVNGVLSMEGTATASASPTYGSAATLQYKGTGAQTTGIEFPATWTASGGVIIANTSGNPVTLNAAKVFDIGDQLTINSGATLATNNFQLTFGGDFHNSGTLSASSSNIIIANNATTQSIDGFSTTGTVSMTKTAGTATFNGNVNGGALTMSGSGGTLNLGNGFTHTFSGTWTRTNGILNCGSSKLRFGAGFTNTGGSFTSGTGTVEWYAAGPQTLAALNYNNLTLSGSGTKATTGVIVNGILSMEGTATVSVAPTYGGTAATLQYNTTIGRTAGAEWITPFLGTGGIIIDNIGTISLNSDKVLSNTVPLNIKAGATLATNNYQLTFGGDFHNSGTFTAGSSAIIITNLTLGQSIDGFTTTGTVSMTKTSGTATFYGNVSGGALTLNGSGGTMDLGTTLTHTFSGLFTRTAGTLDLNTSSLVLSGSNSGTGGTINTNLGTVNYSGAAQTIISPLVYNNLVLSGSGAKTFPAGETTVNGTLSLESTATISLTGTLKYGAAATLNYQGSTAQSTSAAEFPASNGPDNLIINNAYGVNLTFDRILNGDLTINSGSVFTINAGKSLQVLTTTTNYAGNSGLVIKSDASGTGNLIHNTQNVPGTVQRYLTGDITNKPLHYISSPITNAPFASIWQTGDYNVYWYNESDISANLVNSWVRILGSATLNSGTGYSVISKYTSRTDTFKGFLTVPADISSSIAVTNTTSATPANDGWNLIGNPYPCALRADSFITANSGKLDVGFAALYFWNDVDGTRNKSQDYATRSLAGGIAATGNPGNTPLNEISVGQAFFIRANSNTTLSLTAGQRIANNNTQFFIPEPQQIQRLWLSASGPNDLYNEILVGFFEGATTGIDQSYDAYKLKGNADISLYSLADGYNEGFSIQVLPLITEKTEVKLGLNSGIAGNYTFRLKNIENFATGMLVELVDLVTGTITDLRKDTTYTIALNPGEYKSRFLLQFYPESAVGIDKISKSETANIYSSNNKIYISGKLNSAFPATITDITGRVVGTYKISSAPVTEINLEGFTGIYFVSIVTNEGIVTKKILNL